MPEVPPRRLMRFYRKEGNAPTQVPQNTEQNNFRAPPQQDPFAPDGRKLLQELPTIEYEDINSDSYKEMRMLEEKNLEEKLALLEVEKFKKEHHRMPNKQEADRIAENLFAQLKNAGELDKSNRERGSERERRRDRERNEPQNAGQVSAPQQSPIEDMKLDDVKSVLFDEGSPKDKKKKTEDEFDLGLGNEEGGEEKYDDIEGEESIEDLSISDEAECPNCKKSSDKIIFCPKCGTAYCKNCGKKEGEMYICPKCGTKTKA